VCRTDLVELSSLFLPPGNRSMRAAIYSYVLSKSNDY
jgi:hypothetical protein